MACKISWLFDKTWNVLIIDEAQSIKTPEAGLTREIKKLKAHMKLALTGTPIENSSTDLWSLFDFCLPGLLGAFPWFKNSIKK